MSFGRLGFNWGGFGHRGGATIPPLPSSFIYLLGADSAYLNGTDGAYLYGVAP